jgi:nascent polypeptide-associated complex subunit alpha
LYRNESFLFTDFETAAPFLHHGGMENHHAFKIVSHDIVSSLLSL